MHKKILYKTIRDIKKLLAPFLVSIILATSFISLIARYLQGEEIPLINILYLILSFAIILIFGFVIIYFFNWITMRIIDKNIFINLLESAKNPKQKILLQIINDNDDNMTDVQVEFKNMFVGENGNIESVVRADNNFFSKGLIEKSGTISANGSAKIQIAENVDGVLRLLLDDEFNLDVLNGLEEFKKHQVYRLAVKISTKIGDTFFSRDCEFLFSHWIDETVKIISGERENPIYKYSSGVNWEITPTQKKKL
jgi:hypothetical protein